MKYLSLLLLLIGLNVGAVSPLTQTATIASLSQDPNGCFEDQTTSGAASLILDGALVDGPICVFAAAQQIAIEGSGSNAGVTATITGKSVDGVAISEDLTLSNGGTATSSLYYKSISSIPVDGSVDGNIEGGPLKTNGAVGPVIEPSYNRHEASFAIEVIVTGTLTYDVQYSFDECISSTAPIFNTHEILASKTATAVSNIMLPVSCFRVKYSAYTSGTTVLTTIQSPK